MHRRIEHHRQGQTPAPVDIGGTQRIEVGFAAVSLDLLRGIDMESHIHETCVGQSFEQRSCRLAPVGHERGPHAALAYAPHDREQLVARSQRRLAARDLDIRVRAVVAMNEVDAAEYLFQRNVPHRLGVFRQVA